MMFKVTVALDESFESLAAVQWASKTWKKDAVFQLVTVVLPVVTSTVALGVEGDMLTSDATLSVEQENRAVKVAEDATKFACEELKVPREHVSSHVLRPTGGASGVGHSIVEFVCQQQPNVLVMGSRSLNGIQRTFMGLVGAGSVSDYVLHNVNVPVLAVHWNDKIAKDTGLEASTAAVAAAEGPLTGDVPEPAAPPRPGRHIVVSLDDSETAMVALHWAFKYALQPEDTLHLLCVSLPPPLPVLDEVSALVSEHDLERQRHTHWEAAQGIVAHAAAISEGRGIPGTQIVKHCRLPEGGASGVGESIVQYADVANADLVVLGSRGMGAVKAALMNFIGLGSVSEYVMHQARCPVLIVKHDSLSAVPAAKAVPVA